MGDIVYFHPTPPKRRDVNVADARGEILLFTGVRYQRMAEPAPAPFDGEGAPSEGGLRGKRRRKRG